MFFIIFNGVVIVQSISTYKYCWTDKGITPELKKSYVEHYKESVKHLISIASKYQDKDFVIVKAAGNQGLKSLDEEILNDLGRELNSSEFDIMNKHFILVGTGDSRNQAYSNTVTTGNYNSFYTSVDISDLRTKTEKLYGTSFAAPRVSCYISSAINKHGVKATETLTAIKKITRDKPDQPLTQTAIAGELASIIKKAKPAKENIPEPGKNPITTPGNSTGTAPQTSKSTTPYDNLSGSVWKSETRSTVFVDDEYIEFFSNGKIEVTKIDYINHFTLTKLQQPSINNFTGVYWFEKSPANSFVLEYTYGEGYDGTKYQVKGKIIISGDTLTLLGISSNFTHQYTRYYGSKSPSSNVKAPPLSPFAAPPPADSKITNFVGSMWVHETPKTGNRFSLYKQTLEFKNGSQVIVSSYLEDGSCVVADDYAYEHDTKNMSWIMYTPRNSENFMEIGELTHGDPDRFGRTFIEASGNKLTLLNSFGKVLVEYTRVR
jgi:hypothetical protein